jgi:MFS family permease
MEKIIEMWLNPINLGFCSSVSRSGFGSWQEWSLGALNNDRSTVMNTNTTNKSGKGALGFVFTVVLLDIMGLGLLLPIQAHRSPIQRSTDVAMIPMLYAAAQFFAAPLLGKLSDRFGRRPVILYSIAASALGYFLCGIAAPVGLFFPG